MVLMSFSETRQYRRKEPSQSKIFNTSNQSYLIRKANSMNESQHCKKASLLSQNRKTLTHADLIIPSQTLDFDQENTYYQQPNSNRQYEPKEATINITTSDSFLEYQEENRAILNLTQLNKKDTVLSLLDERQLIEGIGF